MSLVIDGFASGNPAAPAPVVPDPPVPDPFPAPFGDGFDGDVFMFQTLDAGDIDLTDGQPFMVGGFETAAYLSLFGGADWWGNLTETDAAQRYEARTEALLQGLAAVPANLRAIEEAVKLDLVWLVEAEAAKSVTVVATIPRPGWVSITVAVVSPEGGKETFTFVENWEAMRAQNVT